MAACGNDGTYQNTLAWSLSVVYTTRIMEKNDSGEFLGQCGCASYVRETATTDTQTSGDDLWIWTAA